MLVSGEVVLCVDARILIEYEEVLSRPLFKIDPRNIEVLMDYIRNVSETHPAVPLDEPLPDADDNPFLEVALSSKADCLVTGNLKHFPVSLRSGVQVLSPRQFLDFFRTKRK
jgi:putative PIN family toxin of toxin-antitoxin system